MNTLTVIATESYEDFAENLQKEIERDAGIRFGVVEPHQFAHIPVKGEDGQGAALGFKESQALYDFLLAQGQIDGQGRIQDVLRAALRDDTFTVPDRFLDQRKEIMSVLRKLAGRLDIKDADKRETARPRQAILKSAEFKALWDRIKHKTTYRVEFDNERLLTECIAALKDAPAIPRTRLQWRKADIAIGKAGVEAAEKEGAATIAIDPGDIELPDLLTELQGRTRLTRRSIYRVLTASGRLADFRQNPQQFIENVARAINWCKQRAIVDGVKYQRIGDGSYYAQRLFEHKELTGYLKNMLSARKAVHDHILYESNTEADFANQLERNMAVKVYAKLPNWFKVATPLGPYNPDWAVLVDSDDGERLYLVIETKSTTHTAELRPAEQDKIKCGRAHFQALATGDSPARYEVAASLDELLAQVRAS